MTIFDLMTSAEIAAYWNLIVQDEAPYPTEELFPAQKKRGLTLAWLKGARGLPIVLKTSAFDAFAIPRPRIGFEKLSADMPYFKESKYIDEELRQELNIVLETGNQAYIDSIMNRVFDDQLSLLRGARAARERMRMMALTTGIVSMQANGQTFNYDYGVSHKGDASVAWSNYATSNPIEDMRVAAEQIRDETGSVITRAMVDGETWRNIRRNETIGKSIFVLSNGQANVSDERLRTYIMDELGIRVLVNDMRYVDETGATVKFMPGNTMSMFPSGNLGNTWFGTTPAESDLMTGSSANVSIVETGVAIVTAKKVDPVQIETIVSQICLPSFEQADSVYILDTEP